MSDIDLNKPQGHDLLHGGYRYRNKPEAPNVRDKMQPSLLDRLTDNAPDKEQESASNRVISPQRAASQRAARPSVVV